MRIRILLVTSLFVAGPLTGGAQAPPVLTLRETWPMNVRGRIDHLAFDATHQRLFVAALGNNTVEVFDTSRDRDHAHVRAIEGFREPQGIAVVPDRNGVAIANGGSGTLQLRDVETLQVRWTTDVGEDADNVRYDARTHRLVVAAVGGLVRVDPVSGMVESRVRIQGHPESFQLDPGGDRVFVNLPDAGQVVVADVRTGQVSARTPTSPLRANYPMALDAATGRLFIGFRDPARLAIADVDSGRVVAAVEAVGDTDDVFYDAQRRRVYVIGGGGFVDVFERNGDTLRRISHMGERPGARTGLWVASQNRLYVARPARGSATADIAVYEAR